MTPPPPEGAEAEPEEPMPENTVEGCTQDFHCHIIGDNCGAPHGRLLGDNTAPAHVDLCPPATYAPTEPICENAECIAGPVWQPEVRRCSDDDECVVIPGLCGVPRAVAASKREEVEHAVLLQGAVIDCLQYSGESELIAQCYSGHCIPRLSSR